MLIIIIIIIIIIIQAIQQYNTYTTYSTAGNFTFLDLTFDVWLVLTACTSVFLQTVQVYMHSELVKCTVYTLYNGRFVHALYVPESVETGNGEEKGRYSAYVG